MIYGYIRVSTDKQTVENQRFEINKYCQVNDIHIDEWIEETISSRVSLEKRKLGKLLSTLTSGDILIATEISRLGRNLFQIMTILQNCLDKGCQVWTIKENYKLGTDITSKVLAFAFSLSAEIERQLISQRTTEALQRVKSTGRHLGRPFGCRCAFAKLKRNREKIMQLVEQQIPKAQIARMFNVSRFTINRLLKYPDYFQNA